MQLWVGLVQTSQLVSRHWRSAASPPSWQICGGLLDPQNAVDGLDGRFILWTSFVWSKYCNQTVQRKAIMIYSTEAGASQGMFERQLETQTLCPWIWYSGLPWLMDVLCPFFISCYVCVMFWKPCLGITQGQCSYSRLAVTCRIEICPLCEWVGVDGWISVPLRMYGTYVVNPVDLSIVGAKQAINRYHLAKAAGPCQSNLPRLSAKLELEIRRVLVVTATEQKPKKSQIRKIR